MNLEHASAPMAPRIRRVAIVLFLVVLAVAGLAAASGNALLWSAVPGRVGAPDATVPAQGPGAGEEPLVRLAVLGDVGTGDANEFATAALVANTGANDSYDGLILLGDNVYPDGNPDRLGATIFEPFAAVLNDGTALLPVLGNHDVEDGYAADQVDILGMPGRWYAATLDPAVLIVALDSNLVDDPDQLAWLEATLTANEAPWVIAAMHHPPYSAGYHGSDKDIQDAWVPVFEQHGVDLVLAGHDHDYQRTEPIGGVTYVVTGAGAKLRPTDRADFTAYAASVLHFVDIGVWNDRLEVTAISADGAFDHVRIDKADQSDASAPRGANEQRLIVGGSESGTMSGLVVAALGAPGWALALLVGWLGLQSR